MMSARSPCRSERTARSTSSIDIGAVVTGLACWAAVHAIADTLKIDTPTTSRRVLRTGSSSTRRPGKCCAAEFGLTWLEGRGNDRACAFGTDVRAPHLHLLGDALHSVR